MNYSKISNSLILDTNVVVSALLAKRPDTPPKRVYQLALDDNHLLIISRAILAEYMQVLRYAKFKFSDKFVHATIRDIRDKAIVVVPSPSDVRLADATDQPFYDLVTTKSAGMPVLVTGNLRHFPRERFIVSPRGYLGGM